MIEIGKMFTHLAVHGDPNTVVHAAKDAEISAFIDVHVCNSRTK